MRRNDLLMLAAAAAFVGASGALSDGTDRAPAAPSALPVAQTARVTAPARPNSAVLQTARAVLNGVGVESAAEKTQVQTALEKAVAFFLREPFDCAVGTSHRWNSWIEMGRTTSEER